MPEKKTSAGKKSTAARGSKASTTKKPAPAKATAKKAAAPKTAAKRASVTKTTTAAKAPAKKAAPAAKKNVIPQKTLEKLKARLLEERETYTRQAEDLMAEAEALMEDREPGDTQFDEESGEGDTLTVERERDLALSATARQAVEEIDEALARIKKGTYGICLRCEKKIPVARLEAVPHAALCIECKSRQERRR